MTKIKFLVLLSFLSVAGIVFSTSPVFISKAENDTVLQEIAEYKNWKLITRESIEGGFQIDGVSGGKNIFIIDGQEVSNFRVGTFG